MSDCKKLLGAYLNGNLGQTKMPEDSNPGLDKMSKEFRLAYFTLPMALNYQRDSYKLWEAALKTYSDKETKDVFDVVAVANSTAESLRKKLLKYKLALQPNKHIDTWFTVSKTISEQWGSFEEFINSTSGDFLKLKQLVQQDRKKGFPYLSGPKIFNYWSFILSTYGGVRLSNREYIDIAPDTHITQCSVKLGLINADDAVTLSKEEISERWRNALAGSGIDPIDMHPPLWFWSRNGFIYNL